MKDEDNLAINISSKPLTEDQIKVVNKGLNYVPTNSMNKFAFTQDFSP